MVEKCGRCKHSSLSYTLYREMTAQQTFSILEKSPYNMPIFHKKTLCTSNTCNGLGLIALNLVTAEDLNKCNSQLLDHKVSFLKCLSFRLLFNFCCIHPINSSLGNSAPEASRSSALAASLSNSSCTGCFTDMLDSMHIFHSFQNL